jgi:methionyl-tRNA formyltransferase
VFGSSFIKGELIDFLVENKAINIHMGLSPYYRGSSCNFWALYDDKPDYVGATIHMLSKGLDSGPMLFHAIPMAEKVTPFVLGMKAVRAAHFGLVNTIENGRIFKMKSMQQDKDLEIRYTKNIDFNDKVASLYLESSHSKNDVYSSLLQRDSSVLLNPFIY